MKSHISFFHITWPNPLYVYETQYGLTHQISEVINDEFELVHIEIESYIKLMAINSW